MASTGTAGAETAAIAATETVIAATETVEWQLLYTNFRARVKKQGDTTQSEGGRDFGAARESSIADR